MKVEVAVLGTPVSNSPDGLCGRKVTWNLNRGVSELRSCVKVEVTVHNCSYGLCGRKASLKDTVTHSESHANVRSESAREQRIALYKSYE